MARRMLQLPDDMPDVSAVSSAPVTGLRIRRHWLSIVACVVIVGLYVGPIGLWPWDHDEVHSFVELGVVPVEEYPGPVGQLQRMRRLVPVWAYLQGAALQVLPHDEWGARVLPVSFGALGVVVAFVAARAAYGPAFGWWLLLLGGTSPVVLWLSQQNRFYPVALFWLVASWATTWSSTRRPIATVLAVLFAILSVLSHNLTVVVFALAGAAAVTGWLSGWVPAPTARRAAAAAVAAVVVYGGYLRPLLAGWQSGGTGGTSPLVSFVAQLGVPVAALALMGGAVAFTRADRSPFRYWVLLLGANLAFVAASGVVMGNWNPRYALFFMPPFWVLAALGATCIWTALPDRRLRAAWACCLVLLLAPKLASHFADGSRHDFRTAATLVAPHALDAPVVSNWPATLQYYLRPATHEQVGFWSPGRPLPRGPVVVVLASNAWEPMLRVPNRRVDAIGQVRRRRFDEQSHVIRAYLVH